MKKRTRKSHDVSDVEILDIKEKKKQKRDIAADRNIVDLDAEQDQHKDPIEDLDFDIDQEITEASKEAEEALAPLQNFDQFNKEISRANDLSDPLNRYIKEISRYSLLSIEEEKRLTKELSETGDINVAKKLVLANLRLVVKIAMEYRHAYQNVMDLIQEGNIGLMKAVSKFDPSKGAKLSYYASWWIKSYILKFILDNFRLIKIGTTNDQKKLFYNLLKEKNRLESMGIKADVKLLSENLGVSEDSVLLMEKRLGPGGGELSMDLSLSENDDSLRLGDTLSSDEEGIDDAIASQQGLALLQENLQGFLKELKPRDQDIFKKRLLSEVPPSLQSIADEYGVSRERIRQIEERLMDSLKLYMSKIIR
jgi:RNA polymerase sigma-32 factor